MNISIVVDHWARYQPEREALVCGDNRITYNELRQRVNKLANGLISLGLRPNDKVALLMDNCNQVMELQLALSKAGAWVVPLNFRYTAGQVRFFVQHSKAGFVVYHDYLEERLAEVDSGALAPGGLICLGGGKRSGRLDYEEIIASGSADEPENAADLADIQAIMYTSGSTGQPKGAMLSHGNWLWNAMGFNLVLSPQALRSAVVAVPMFHTAGLHCVALPVLLAGGRVVILPLRGGFQAADLAAAISREKVTYTYLAPEMWILLSRLPNAAEYDFSSLECCLGAGGLLPPKAHEKLARDFGVNVMMSYGLTEAAPIVMIATPEHKDRNPDTVGRPIFFPEVRLVDDRDADVPVGAAGECVIRGPNVCHGYYKADELNSEVMRGGWLHTGDILRRDDDGLYYFAGRKKDMIKSGGENIFAAEVEEVLNRNPKIMESAVIGVPHAKWGEGVMALIVVRQGESLSESEVVAYCKEAMAGYKRPQVIEMVKDIPKLATGKVDKVSIRKQYGALYR